MVNRTILVIDSQQTVFEQLKDSLQCRLEHVLYSEPHDEAYKIAQNQDIDLILVIADNLSTGLLKFFYDLRTKCPSAAGMLAAEDFDTELLIEAVNSGISRVCRLPTSPENIIKAVLETLAGKDVQSEIDRLKALLPVYDLGRKFISAESESAIYQELVDTVARELKVQSASVLLFDRSLNVLKLVAQKGLNPAFVKDLTIKPGERIAGRVFQSQSPVILNKSSEVDSPYRDMLERNELAASICFPFVSKEEAVLGVLNISQTIDGKEYCEADVDMLRIITDQALMAVENLRFVQQREDQKRVRLALEQYISPEISEVLIADVNTEELLDIGGIHDLTVLFADIRNFTMLAQELSLDSLRLFLNKFFEIFSRAVFAEKGMLDKFMGDAVLAVFGAPLQQDNPCTAAVSAACQIAHGFEMLRQQWVEQYPVFEKVSLGLGVSKGPMFLGNVGSSERLDYTVLGLDVNIAQRLASETSSGRVYVTESIHECLDERFVVDEITRKKLRGVRNEMNIYAVTLKTPD